MLSPAMPPLCMEGTEQLVSVRILSDHPPSRRQASVLHASSLHGVDDALVPPLTGLVTGWSPWPVSLREPPYFVHGYV